MGVKRRVIVGLAVSLVGVWGQNSNVQQCIPSYDWTINGLGQTPCLVAAYLESGCGTPAKVDAIPPGTHYIGPSVVDSDGCHCSSVTYSLISACAGCQNRSYLNWTMWSHNCSAKFETSYPGTILTGTSVPQWAYLNVSETNDTFDPIVAARTVSVTFPSSLLSGTVASTAITSFLLSSATTSPSANSTRPNLGAIVGGVLGGSVAVAIILLVLLIWFLKRRSNGTQKDVVFDRIALVSGQPTTSGTSTPFGRSHGTYTTTQNTTDSPLVTSSLHPSSPYSATSRRSLDGPSPSIRYFGTKFQPNRHPGLRADEGNVQI